MLETVREHAIARLDAEGRLDELRRRHAERFLGLAAAAEDELDGPDQAAWLERLERELDNIRAALDWFLASGRVEDALRAVSSLGRFWRAHGHASEARRLAPARSRARETPRRTSRAKRSGPRLVRRSPRERHRRAPALEEALASFARGPWGEVVFALSELAFIALEQRHRAARSAVRRGARGGAEARRSRERSRARSTPSGRSSAHGRPRRASAMYEEASPSDGGWETRSWLRMRPTTSARLRSEVGISREHSAFEESLALARELGDGLHTAAATGLLGE